MTDVYLNNKYIGNVDDYSSFIKDVKDSRRNKKLPDILNIMYNKEYDNILIVTSKGRARRPLIVVEDRNSKFTEDHAKQIQAGQLKWADLVDQGIIEYLDASEEENVLIGLEENELTLDHTHLEISPILLLGMTSSLVPYANYANPIRLEMGTKNQKQALGLYCTNYLLRNDTDVSVLHYPQIPIVKSFTQELIGIEKNPAGQNFVVAVMSYEGYNMEDSVIINKSSVQRGLGRSMYFKPYSVEELRYSGGLMDNICLPDKDIKGYKSEEDYKMLEKDGIIYTGAKLESEEVIIGKTSPPRFLGEIEEFSVVASTRRESSTNLNPGDRGTVDLVVLTENEEGNKLIQVRIYDERIPEIGDKFTSRHGQKGVIGMLIPQQDMPFTSKGVVPDLIFSPHSLPKRMTISHLLEILAGKAGALGGKYIDGTSFDSKSEEELRKELEELGFEESGTETMYNGITGDKFKVKIFIGNLYYLKLRHMVANKIHSRASGRIQLLTRQPIEGRARGGGLRLGEMEKDCFVAYGASLLLKERFDSDKVVIHICEKCGSFAVHDSYRSRQFCSRCGSGTEISPIELSYAFKLLIDEIKSLLINPKIVLESKYK